VNTPLELSRESKNSIVLSCNSFAVKFFVFISRVNSGFSTLLFKIKSSFTPVGKILYSRSIPGYTLLNPTVEVSLVKAVTLSFPESVFELIALVASDRLST
jgi:hypothetical protein